MSIVIDKGLYTSIKITISNIDFTSVKSIMFTLKRIGFILMIVYNIRVVKR